MAQTAQLPNFKFNKVLNSATLPSNIGDIKAELIILDFFGTWCVPCVKALPHLEEIKKNYKDKLEILLISIETEDRLRNFLLKNKQISLPIIVDNDEQISNYIKPTAYPYSIVLNNKLQNLGYITAAQLTNEYIDSLLATTYIRKETVEKETKPVDMPTYNENKKGKVNTTAQLAADLLLAVKSGESVQEYLKNLENLSEQQLTDSVVTNEDKIAFWVNLYNAFANYALKNNPNLFKKRNRFFASKFINIAGKKLSLDDIEHGILRRSKIKLSLGYLNKLFVNKFEKKHRVHKLDWRIHFALNCGAKSCPPIAFYSSDKLEAQLNTATKNYLQSDCEINTEKNKVAVPILMSWFRKDFGGKKAILPILKRYEIIPESSYPKIEFKKYDWTLYTENYK